MSRSRTPRHQRVVDTKREPDEKDPTPEALDALESVLRQLERLCIRPDRVESHELGGYVVIFYRSGERCEATCDNEGEIHQLE